MPDAETLWDPTKLLVQPVQVRPDPLALFLRLPSKLLATRRGPGLHRARGVAKLTAVRATEFAKRLDLSKDTVLEAQMQQRRWERALGVAIREGQERGEIATQATGRPRGSTFQESTSVKLSDLATSTELHGKRGDGIYALTDNATDDQFESALTEARDEGRQRR